MDLIHEDERIYMKNDQGEVVAEILFPTHNGVAEITATFVHPSLRGQGMAQKLIQEALLAFRQKGLKAAPVCSFAVAWFENHPEDQDLLAD